mmetsp:Transcript_5183/g.15503  ORF Transcript_5183/g.15503 Transcript_5183/m.15503 type:complete len:1200 (+) Transcript_5183:216-3815(+)
MAREMSKGLEEVKLGPGWMPHTRKTGLSLESTAPPEASASDGAAKRGKQKFTKSEILAMHRSGLPMPRGMHEFAGITVKEPLLPVNLCPGEINAGVDAINGGPVTRVQKSRLAAFDPKTAADQGVPAGGLHRRNFPSASDSSATSGSAPSSTSKRGVLGSSNPADKSGAYWSRGARSNADSTSNWRGDGKATTHTAPTPAAPSAAALPPLAVMNRRDLSGLVKKSSDRDRERGKSKILVDPRRIWQYKDPQGDIQGPFAAAQLMEWLKAGFYTDELLVKKTDEDTFKPLAYAFKLKAEENVAPPGFVKPERTSVSPPLKSEANWRDAPRDEHLTELPNDAMKSSLLARADEPPNEDDMNKQTFGGDVVASVKTSSLVPDMADLDLGKVLESSDTRSPSVSHPLRLFNFGKEGSPPKVSQDAPAFPPRPSGSPTTSRFAGFMSSNSGPNEKDDETQERKPEVVSKVPASELQTTLNYGDEHVSKAKSNAEPSEKSLLELLGGTAALESEPRNQASRDSPMDVDPAIASFGYQVSTQNEAPAWRPFGGQPVPAHPNSFTASSFMYDQSQQPRMPPTAAAAAANWPFQEQVGARSSPPAPAIPALEGSAEQQQSVRSSGEPVLSEQSEQQKVFPGDQIPKYRSDGDKAACNEDTEQTDLGLSAKQPEYTDGASRSKSQQAETAREVDGGARSTADGMESPQERSLPAKQKEKKSKPSKLQSKAQNVKQGGTQSLEEKTDTSDLGREAGVASETESKKRAKSTAAEPTMSNDNSASPTPAQGKTAGQSLSGDEKSSQASVPADSFEKSWQAKPKMPAPWTSPADAKGGDNKPSLREIQLEEAKRLESERKRQQEIAKEQTTQEVSTSQRSSAGGSVWGNIPTPQTNTSLLDILREEAIEKDKVDRTRAQKAKDNPESSPTRQVPQPNPIRAGVWGGVAAQSPPAPSLREQMRLEEEKRKSEVTEVQKTGHAVSSGWADKVAPRPLAMPAATARPPQAVRSAVPQTAASVVSTPSNLSHSRSQPDDSEMFWETAGKSGSAKKPARPVTSSATMPLTVTPSLMVRRPQVSAAPLAKKTEAPPAAQEGTNAFGARMSVEFTKWCQQEMRKITGSSDITLPEFLFTLKTPSEVQEYVYEYLGSNSKTQAFADEFIRRRNFERGDFSEANSNGGNWTVVGNGDAGGRKKGKKKGSKLETNPLEFDAPA